MKLTSSGFELSKKRTLSMESDKEQFGRKSPRYDSDSSCVDERKNSNCSLGKQHCCSEPIDTSTTMDNLKGTHSNHNPPNIHQRSVPSTTSNIHTLPGTSKLLTSNIMETGTMSIDTKYASQQINIECPSTPTDYEDEASSSCDSYSSCGDSSLSSTPSPFISTQELNQQTHKSKPLEMNQLDPAQFSTDASPDIYIQQLFTVMLEYKPTTKPTLELSPRTYNSSDKPFIPPITDMELANYDIDVVSATRENDLDALRALHSNGRSLSCCNRYGESLMHMACRRGFFSIVTYLMTEASVPIRITDDCGRTPLHDALWHKECQYSTVDLLVRSDPSLLFLCDKHGHTPFAYARREHWGVWKQFLWDRRQHMWQAIDRDVMKLFHIER